MKKSIIEVETLSFSYNGENALEDISLTVVEGDFFCLIGPNGGGKSTLLKILTGFLKPSKGTVKVFGNNPVKARSRIGYLPQELNVDSYFPVSVQDVVNMGRLNHKRFIGPYSPEDYKITNNLLERFELVEFKLKAFSALSRGQRQRTLIARTCACQPELLILDEPMSNLDSATEDFIYRMLKEINRHATIVMVTHNMERVNEYANKLLSIKKHAIVHAEDHFNR